MGMFVEKTASDQLVSGLFFLAAGLVIAPYVAALLVSVVERMNASGPWPEQRDQFLSIGRYFFTFGAAMFAVLGAVRLAIYMSVKSGLIAAPWGIPG